jgi:hypothetical protein
MRVLPISITSGMMTKKVTGKSHIATINSAIGNIFCPLFFWWVAPQPVRRKKYPEFEI